MSYPISLPLYAAHGDALATLSHSTPEIWELEMHNGLENRLTAEFVTSCLSVALDLVERDWRSNSESPGALIITGSKDSPKFFSNGLDYENASKDSSFGANVWDPFVKRILGFPIPTVAAINGHAFAAGFILALLCDYRVMTSGKAWCSMNEIFFGAPFTPTMCAILNHKLPSPTVIRKTAMEGHRWTPTELVELGIVDALVEPSASLPATTPDPPRTSLTTPLLDAARRIALKHAPLAKTAVYGLIKAQMARKIIDDGVALDNRLVHPRDQVRAFSVRHNVLGKWAKAQL